MKFKERHYLVFILLILFQTGDVFGQTSQSGCTVTFDNNFDAQVDISSIYNPALCPSGDLILDNLNDKNGFSTVTFDSDINLNSLTLNYKAGNNPLEIIIPFGVTVNIANDLVMNLASTVQDKFLTVDGSLVVGGTIDFGDITLEIDGTGSIAADAIIGADNVGCVASGTCPSTTSNTCDSGTGDYCTTALPIELVSFSLNNTKDGVLVEWITATEENNDFFSVQRSRNGIEFETIRRVDGAGNSTSALQYEYLDKTPFFGQSYYRLKQTDFDGTSETFHPLSVYVTTLSELVLSPNPVERGNTLEVYSEVQEGETAVLKIYNTIGIVVYAQPLSLGVNEIKIDRETFETGFYVVKAQSGASQSVKRLLVK